MKQSHFERLGGGPGGKLFDFLVGVLDTATPVVPLNFPFRLPAICFGVIGNSRIAMNRERNGEGRFTETTLVEDVLEVFENHEPLTTQEVADRAGIVKRTAYKKLNRLVEQNAIERKDIGKLAIVWYRSE